MEEESPRTHFPFLFLQLYPKAELLSQYALDFQAPWRLTSRPSVVLRGHGRFEIIIGPKTAQAGVPTSVTRKMPQIGLRATPATRPAGLPTRDGRKARLLVVDDEPALLNVLALLIRRSGCEVLTARDAEEAWTCVEQEGDGLDGMFTDVFMPGELDGLALAAKVHHARPALPVVLVTGWPEKLDAKTRKNHAVLDKPFNAQRLATALATVLRPPPEP